MSWQTLKDEEYCKQCTASRSQEDAAINNMPVIILVTSMVTIVIAGLSILFFN